MYDTTGPPRFAVLYSVDHDQKHATRYEYIGYSTGL